MKRFERGASGSTPAPAAAVPTSVDFFGTARAPIQPVQAPRKSPHSSAGNGKAAKRARMPSGQASTTLEREDHGASEHSSDDDAGRVGSERQNVSEDEGDGVRLFSGGEITKGTSERGQGVGKKGKKATKSENAREELAVFRRQMRISVAGDEVPTPAGSFEEMRFPKEVGWLRSGIEAAGTSIFTGGMVSFRLVEFRSVRQASVSSQGASLSLQTACIMLEPFYTVSRI